MPSREQRVRVWRGELNKTTGGLKKEDLVKNKRGKLVSRRKSKQAAEQNNLGEWLRNKGDQFKDVPKKVAKKSKAKPKAKGPISKKAEVSVTNIVAKRKRKKVDYKKFY